MTEVRDAQTLTRPALAKFRTEWSVACCGRRITVVEFMTLAKILRFDPYEFISTLKKTAP